MKYAEGHNVEFADMRVRRLTKEQQARIAAAWKRTQESGKRKRPVSVAVAALLLDAAIDKK